MVERDIFGATALPPPPERREEALAYICDELCKYRVPGRTQEELDAICEKCRVDRWSGDPPALTPEEARQFHVCQGFLKEVRDYVNGGEPPRKQNRTPSKICPRAYGTTATPRRCMPWALCWPRSARTMIAAFTSTFSTPIPHVDPGKEFYTEGAADDGHVGKVYFINHAENRFGIPESMCKVVEAGEVGRDN